MTNKITANILRVFANEEGKFGNPVGIIVDESQVFNKDKRQQMALNSGFSEIVFINDIKKRNISIFSPHSITKYSVEH